MVDQQLAIAVLGSPALGATVSIAGTFAGYFLRAHQTKSNARTSIATKVLELQRYLADLAFDEEKNIQWRKEKPQWAVDAISKQIALRMDDLASTASAAGLEANVIPLLGIYRDAVEDFLTKWFVTESRQEGNDQGFWNNYHQTKKALHGLLRSLRRFHHIEQALTKAGIADFDGSRDASRRRSKNPLGYSQEVP